MANTTLSQALAIALTLTDEDKATLTQMLVALNGARVSAPSTLVEQTESAPTRKERNTTRKECVDTEIHVASMGKGHVRFFVVDEDGKERGVATRYMRCVKDLLSKSDMVVEYDKAFEREDVYAKDYTDNEGVFHAKGTHKHGAYMLMKIDGKGNRKAMAQASVTKWVNEHKVLNVSGVDAQTYEDKRVERNIRKNERDARKGA